MSADRLHLSRPARGLFVARVVRGARVIAMAIENTLELAAEAALWRAQEVA